MESEDRVVKLLEEIRDDQRVMVEEYRRIANQALGLQNKAVDKQESLGRVYKVVVAVGAVLVVVIIGIIVWLLTVIYQYL
jgi:CHASE3 domain sensor protein